MARYIVSALIDGPEGECFVENDTLAGGIVSAFSPADGRYEVVSLHADLLEPAAVSEAAAACVEFGFALPEVEALVQAARDMVEEVRPLLKDRGDGLDLAAGMLELALEPFAPDSVAYDFRQPDPEDARSESLFDVAVPGEDTLVAHGEPRSAPFSLHWLGQPLGARGECSRCGVRVEPAGAYTFRCGCTDPAVKGRDTLPLCGQ